MNFVVFETLFPYDGTMGKTVDDKQILREAMHLQAMENNALDDDQVAMFEMFVREGWSPQKRLAYIRKRAQGHCAAPAAE